MSAPMMEVCVDSVKSALNAAEGGAMRLELCSALSEGGLTPSVGTLTVIKQLVSIPVFVMLRPRGGLDYCYSSLEMEALKIDAELLKANGADGFVFGALTIDGAIDAVACAEILSITAPLPVTFHRAFDVSRNLLESLDTVIMLGFQRVLTSGGENSAELGLSRIKELISRADGRLVIMPGAGINKDNLKEILDVSKTLEFHGSAKVEFSGMIVTSEALVRDMVNIAGEVNQ